MDSQLTQEKLKAIMTFAPTSRIAAFLGPLQDAMHSAQMNTCLRQAHFLAQIAHESGEMRYTEEIANGSAYEGRKDLGNTSPGDGVMFKGRGLIQITGRANYNRCGQAIGHDFISNPTDLSRLPYSVLSATWFWSSRNLNLLADQDNVEGITRRINGGLNGLDDRKQYLARAKKVLGC